MNEETILNEYIAEHDRILGTCDAYDVKASIWLAVIIFLALQTGDMLGKGLPTCLLYGQWLSAILLVAAGISTLIELYPRDYSRYFPSSGVMEKWNSEMREAHKGEPDVESLIFRKGVAYRLVWFREMIAENKELNARKAGFLMFSFWTAAIAAGTNLLTVAILLLVSRTR